MKELLVNSLIEWVDEESDSKENRMERVLWIDESKDVVVVIGLDKNSLPRITDLSEVQKALSVGKAIKRLIDPKQIPILDDKELPLKYVKIRDESWEKIKSLVTDEPHVYDTFLRGLMIRDVIESYGYRKGTLYEKMRQYWQGGKTKNALLPNYKNCGGSGKSRSSTNKKRGRPSLLSSEEPDKVGINVNEDMRRIFATSGKLFYHNYQKPPLRRVYKQMIEKFFNCGLIERNGVQVPVLPSAHELPTYKQFEYWFRKDQDIKKSLISREGIKNFKLRHRSVLGSSKAMAMGPGSIYQIDATIADVYLVSGYNSNWIIGRPVLYVVMDVFSRMIVGVHVGLEGPSWLGASMALANAFEDKIEYCQSLGINITAEQWGSKHLPEFLLADRGEIFSKASDVLVQSLNVGISNTPPFRADWKGIVEQHFRLLNLKVVHWVPGAVQSRKRERGDRDYRLDATLNLKEFTQIIVYSILHHNTSHWMENYSLEEFMIEDEVKPIPIELWNWGIRNRSGHLREQPSDIIRLGLLPREQAVVTFRGIRFKGMHYSCDAAIQEQWFERARQNGSWKVTVAYDVRNTNNIYIVDSAGMKFNVCTLLEREARYKNRRLEEVIDLLQIESLNAKKHKSSEMQADADLHAQIEQVVSDALKRKEKEKSTSSKSSKIKNIRMNRRHDKELSREQDAWVLENERGSKESSRAKVTKETGQEFTSKHHIEELNDELPIMKSKQNTLLDMLAKQREKG